MKIAGKICLLAFALFVCAPGFVFSAEMKIKVIKLQHRQAKEVIPIVKPMLPAGTSITGQGYKLFVKAAPATLNEIESMIKQIDTAIPNLIISVRRGGAGSQDHYKAIAGAKTFRTHKTSAQNGVQQVRKFLSFQYQ